MVKEVADGWQAELRHVFSSRIRIDAIGLESRCAFTGTGGSNPSPSAEFAALVAFSCGLFLFALYWCERAKDAH